MQNEADEPAAASGAEGWRSAAAAAAWSKDSTPVTDSDGAGLAVAQAGRHAVVAARVRVPALRERRRAGPSQPIATHEDDDFAD